MACDAAKKKNSCFFRAGFNSKSNILIGSRSGIIGIDKLVFLVLVLLIVGVLLIRPASVPALTPVVIILAPVLLIIAFTDFNFALLLLILFMLFSPEFVFGGGVRGRDVMLRLDDLLLLIVGLVWMTKTALSKQLGAIRLTPLNRAIITYMTIYIVCTLIGVLRGTVRWVDSIFYLVKYLQYFVLYFMVSSVVKEKRQAKFFLNAMFIVLMLISLFAWSQYFGGVLRASAPFERGGGEPNTLGGYLVFMMMLVAGLMLNTPVFKEKLWYGILLAVSFPALLFTLSRGSWAAFVAAYIVLMILSRRGKQMLLIVSLLLIILFSVIFPVSVQERLAYTFQPHEHRTVMGRELIMDASSAARIDTWHDSIRHWMQSPVFGSGASSGGAALDNHYMRVLIETGMLGLIGFILLAIAIFRNAMRSLAMEQNDGFSHGLSVGFIAGFLGLLVHSFAAASFIIIRIMEPFWFVAAIVMLLPELENDQLTRASVNG